jgi:ATP/ADP translocase/HEAT repeat protein
MFLDIRKGEALLTFLMFSYYYLVLVTYYLLKPARDSLFLIKLGAAQLPLVFILTALIIAPITTVYSQASRSLRLSHLIYITSAILIVNLIVLRWLLGLEASWVFYVFYMWVSIYGALTASQYWLFANAVFDPAQGKRLFVLLNLGGILGAMTGGEVTSLIVSRFGVETEDLLFFCIAFIAAFTVIVGVAWRLVLKNRREGVAPKKRAAKEEAKEKFTDMFGMIKRSRHLLYLVGIIALTMATASFVDFQFKTISLQSFPEKQQLTSFLGTFYGRLSLVSLLLQVVFSYRILRVFGVTGIVMFLPLGLLFGSVAMFIFPGLVAAILLRGADGAFKYSLDKTGRELLFLPVPLEVKKRTKVFIDVFVDRWFRGVAGAGLLLCTVVLGLSVRQLSLVVIAMLAVWVTLVVLIRKQYVNAFRTALARREIDPSQLTINITDAATVRTLREALRGGNDREISYALNLLSAADDKSLLEDLGPLLRHDSGEIRLNALQLISRLDPDAQIANIMGLMRDEDPEVRLAAIRSIELREGLDAVAKVVREASSDGDPRVKASEIRFRAEKLGHVDPEIAAGLVEQSREHPAGEEVRVEVARSIGALGGGGSAADMRDVVKQLLADESDRVTAETIVSIGHTRDRDYVPTLIDFLRDHRRRKFARDALVEFGDGVVGTLSDVLGDDRSDIAIRRYIPVVLSRIPTQKSVDSLALNLTAVDSTIRFRIVKALNRLRQRYPDLRIKEEAIDNAFVEETKIYYEILQISSMQKPNNNSEADALLARALDERLTLNLERIFRLLGLNYPAKDIYNAYLGIVSPYKDRHASAVEFLDNVVGKNIKKYLLPIIDRISEAVAIKRGQELFGLEVKTRDDALLKLIDGSDAWLKTCAIYCVTQADSEEVQRAARGALRDHDPIVVETAKLVLARLS